MNLEKLFNPQSIAIVGASQEEGKVGNAITKNLLELGYSGQVYLVNSKYENLFDRPCYKTVQDIETPVDLAIIVIPAKFVNQVINEAGDKVKNFVVISAGFSETDEEGKQREKELAQIAQEKNLNILGPNCLGFIIPQLQLNASFAGGMPKAGNIAFISQSGALAVAIMDIFEKENTGFSHIVSIGNKMQISETELLEYLAKDENVKVITMYLEGIKNGRKFMEAASQVSKIKPIIILKAGKTAKSQKAISSHTGALAGSSLVTSAVFKKSGVIEVDTLEDFLGLVNIISLTPAPQNDAVVVITNAGGPGVLTTDAFQNKAIKLLEIDAKAKDKLKKFLPLESSLENPIDLLGDADEKRYKKTLEIIDKNLNPGTILCLLTPQDQTPVSKITAKIIQFKNKSNRNVVTSFIGGHRVQKSIKKLQENGIPNFSFPEEAVEALDKYYQWNSSQNKSEDFSQNQIHEERKKKAQEIIAKAKSENRTALYFSEASELVDLYGIATVDTQEVKDQTQHVNISFPVVLKVDSDKVLHKTEKQGLILGIQTEEELNKYVVQMRTNFPGERLIIQPMLARKTELILGINRDQLFGPIVVYGLGGIYTEVFKMVDFLIPPSSQEEIIKALENSKIKFLFSETRGQKPYNVNQLADILWGISFMALELEEIKEFDINPLLIYNDGNNSIAVDVKIII